MSTGSEVTRFLLAHHHLGVSEHVCAGLRASQAATVAGRLSGYHQYLLCCAVHMRDVPQDVLAWPSGQLGFMKSCSKILVYLRASALALCGEASRLYGVTFTMLQLVVLAFEMLRFCYQSVYRRMELAQAVKK